MQIAADTVTAIVHCRNSSSSTGSCYSAPDRGADCRVLWWVCLSVCLCVCLSVRDHIFGTTRPIFTNFFVHVTCGRGSVLLWRRSDTLRISSFIDDIIFAHKLRLLDVAARLRQWGSHAALGLACRNTRCRQRMLGTTSCSQGRLGHSGHVK